MQRLSPPCDQAFNADQQCPSTFTTLMSRRLRHTHERVSGGLERAERSQTTVEEYRPVQQRSGHSAQSKAIEHEHERRDGGDGATNDKRAHIHTLRIVPDRILQVHSAPCFQRVLVMPCVEMCLRQTEGMIQHPVSSQRSVGHRILLSAPCRVRVAVGTVSRAAGPGRIARKRRRRDRRRHARESALGRHGP